MASSAIHAGEAHAPCSLVRLRIEPTTEPAVAFRVELSYLDYDAQEHVNWQLRQPLPRRGSAAIARSVGGRMATQFLYQGWQSRAEWCSRSGRKPGSTVNMYSYEMGLTHPYYPTVVWDLANAYPFCKLSLPAALRTCPSCMSIPGYLLYQNSGKTQAHTCIQPSLYKFNRLVSLVRTTCHPY